MSEPYRDEELLDAPEQSFCGRLWEYHKDALDIVFCVVGVCGGLAITFAAALGIAALLLAAASRLGG